MEDRVNDFFMECMMVVRLHLCCHLKYKKWATDMSANKLRESKSTNIKIHINRGRLGGKISQHIALWLSILLPYPYNKYKTAGHKVTFAFLQPQRYNSQKYEYGYCFRKCEEELLKESYPMSQTLPGHLCMAIIPP